MQKTLLALIFGILFMPVLSFAGTFTVAIKNDPEVLKYWGVTGPFTIRLFTHEKETTITCDGKKCPTQIKENQTINFTVNSPNINRYLGFGIEFKAPAFTAGHQPYYKICKYWISSGHTPVEGGKMRISELPPFGGTRECGSTGVA